MTTEPDNLVLEHLRAIRAEMARLSDGVRSLGIDMTAMRQHLAGVVTLQEHDHGEIAALKHRLDRVEQRLDLVD